MNTWTCFCGAAGLGDHTVLVAHVKTHPRVRMAIGMAIHRLCGWLDGLAWLFLRLERK